VSSKIITLLRHGKVAGAAALYGHTDIELSDDGYAELSGTLNRLHQKNPIQQITSSPLIRCAKIAHEFSTLNNIPLQILPALKEMHFGSWDGVAFAEMSYQWAQVEVFWQTPATIQPPEGESLDAFAGRIIHAWQDLVTQCMQGHHLILCHGGVIRIIIAHILQMDWRNPGLFKQLHIDYSSHTRIDIAAHENAMPIIRWIGVIDF
jgi:alpha-ribazole phosphatase